MRSLHNGKCDLEMLTRGTKKSAVAENSSVPKDRGKTVPIMYVPNHTSSYFGPMSRVSSRSPANMGAPEKRKSPADPTPRA